MSKRPAAVDETWLRTQAALGTLLARVTPWLLDLGNWIFGALIAFSLVILGAMLTVGPVDRAVLVATAAFALALPLDVAGFVLLRIAVDMKKVDLETVATAAFVEAGFTSEEVGQALDPRESEQKRTRKVLLYSYNLLGLTALLTLVGMTAALWHMAWWIGVGFAAMLLLSLSIVGGALTTYKTRRAVRPAK
ncbi:MAG TPA: hypothetical protein VMP38_00400 [Candidatus Acidoferrum sp.]|nr:hypothetical protein [Candidatus Acidoferrum sp.]